MKNPRAIWNSGGYHQVTAMIEDAELLRRYAQESSQAAFAELVKRHVNFVYASALRRVGGDTHLAEDVTQQVFTALARNAAALARREVLSGWLYTTARNVAAQLVRGECRRHVRESKAQLMSEATAETTHDKEWERLRPVLDDAMDSLGGDDRQAVLLRYFEGKSYGEIGARLRLAENTARMRVDRALEKLRAALTRRGVTSTSAGLAVAIANQAGVAAPAGLAASVAGAALSGAIVGAGGWATTLLGIGKLQAGIAGSIAVAGAALYVQQAETNAVLRREIAALHEQRPAIAALRSENQQLATVAAEVEMLRRDDIELKQLAERVAEVKRANEQSARVAAARARDRVRELEEWLREQDRVAQAEVERMNREGNALVEIYKKLTAQAKDGTLNADERGKADMGAKLKFAEMQAKQRDIKAYIEETRRALTEHHAELRRLQASGVGPASPPGASAAQERLELQRRAAEIEQRRSARISDPSSVAPSGNGKLILKP
jgi:RNA polymerase sigma factor (sigma-70 family)